VLGLFHASHDTPTRAPTTLIRLSLKFQLLYGPIVGDLEALLEGSHGDTAGWHGDRPATCVVV
jgi:hypothetical protein